MKEYEKIEIILNTVMRAEGKYIEMKRSDSMEFPEIMKEWRRMCDSYESACIDGDGCKDCEIYRRFPNGCDAIFADFGANADWKVVQSIIEDWSKNNPAPQYPTWYDFVFEQLDTELICDDHDLARQMCATRIPAEIAEKLGLKPE